MRQFRMLIRWEAAYQIARAQVQRDMSRADWMATCIECIIFDNHRELY